MYSIPCTCGAPDTRNILNIVYVPFLFTICYELYTMQNIIYNKYKQRMLLPVLVSNIVVYSHTFPIRGDTVDISFKQKQKRVYSLYIPVTLYIILWYYTPFR